MHVVNFHSALYFWRCPARPWLHVTPVTSGRLVLEILIFPCPRLLVPPPQLARSLDGLDRAVCQTTSILIHSSDCFKKQILLKAFFAKPESFWWSTLKLFSGLWSVRSKSGGVGPRGPHKAILHLGEL